MPASVDLSTCEKWWDFIQGMNDYYIGAELDVTDVLSQGNRTRGFQYAAKLDRLVGRKH
jgi:hypothetical protein